MIDVKALEQKDFEEAYRKNLKDRGEDPGWVDKIFAQNKQRKALLLEMETSRADQNRVGVEIANKKKNKEDATELLQQMQAVALHVKSLDSKAKEADEALRQILLRLPNKLDLSVPVGQSEADNVEVRRHGTARKFNFTPLDHSTLGEKLKILDFDRGAKVAGARFTFLRGAAARLERSLIQFMLDVHSDEHSYQEMIPPFIANSKSFEGVGQFPKFKEDVFHLTGFDYALIPTAEVPVTNFYAEEILEEADLPQRFAAYSPCFRSEAGSYGRDTKGLIRQHQFNKVELMIHCTPEKSHELHEQLTRHAEIILQRLELPYRVMNLCSKDISFGAAKCYDIEVWLPSAAGFREISSCSNFEDFQARRANIRYRPKGEKTKPRFVHTINGSGLAVGRTLIAIMENYQHEDGSIAVPAVLQPYMGIAQIK